MRSPRELLSVEDKPTLSPGTLFTVRLTPKASRNVVQGWSEGAEGERILKASVTAVPEKGKANQALIALLSKEFKIPKSKLQIVRGETDRTKTVKVVE